MHLIKHIQTAQESVSTNRNVCLLVFQGRKSFWKSRWRWWCNWGVRTSVWWTESKCTRVVTPLRWTERVWVGPNSRAQLTPQTQTEVRNSAGRSGLTITGERSIPGVTKLCNLWAGRAGFDSRQEQRIFLLAIALFSPALGPTPPPIKWVPGALYPGRESDHLPPFSSEERGATPPLSHTSSWCCT